MHLIPFADFSGAGGSSPFSRVLTSYEQPFLRMKRRFEAARDASADAATSLVAPQSESGRG